MALPVLEDHHQLDTPRLEVELISRREAFLGNLRVALQHGQPRRNLELNLSGVSSRNLALSVLLHVAALGAMLVIPVIRFDSPIVADTIENKLSDPVLIYYPAPSLPSMEDTGGSANGFRARVGGRAAFHPVQAIHVTR